MAPEVPVVTVPWQRLADDVFDVTKGDVYAAQSCDKPHDRVATFSHEGKVYTNMGGCHGSVFTGTEAHCHQLLPFTEEQPPKVEFSSEGKAVKWRGQQYRLGPKILFKQTDRTVSEWQAFARRVYDRGGSFTASRTYHQVLKEILDGPNFHKASDTALKAIVTELSGPDYNKHKPSGAAPVKNLLLKQTELTFV